MSISVRTALSLSLATILISSNGVFAQSSVIQFGSPHAPNSNQVRLSHASNSISDNLSVQQKHWEHVLARKYPGALPRKLSCAELIIRLRRIGLPVVLDESARVDYLDEGEILDFNQFDEPLYETLSGALSRFNATLAFRKNRIAIVSMDVAYDPSYFTTIIYDISSLRIGPSEDGSEPLIAMFQAVVDPDGWAETNGDGVIQVNRFTGRDLLTVSTSYFNQREIRGVLDDISNFRGAPLPFKNRPYLNSRIVKLPTLSAEEKRKRKIRGKGIGGFGGGGGVF